MRRLLEVAVAPLSIISIGYGVTDLAAKHAARDDTDPPDGRSGLRLYTDHLTGCQYVSNGAGGTMHPRMDRNGKQICR